MQDFVIPASIVGAGQRNQQMEDFTMEIGRKLILTAAAAVAGTMAAPASAAEVTLRGASCFPIGSPPASGFVNYVKELNARGKGVVQIKLLGGAPAIGSPFTLTQKMSKGAYDIVGCTEAYYGNVIPEAPVLRLAGKTSAELRKNGAYDYVERLLNAKNIHFIGRNIDFGPFNLWLSKKIDKPDLTGLNLRVAPVYTAFFKSLGATVQTSAMPQIYTLMENNTVQGFGWPAGAFIPPWIKVTKYQVLPGFYTSPIQTLVNLKKWKSLSKAQQDIITKVGLEFEEASEPGNAKMAAHIKKGNAMRAKGGVKVIEFTGAERKKWLDMAYGEAWKEVIERSPKHGKALQKLFR
ncbi:MAG: TRAP transporter substrate-binding protein DctP [Rhodospirillales bacterium]|nr:TRAP transporter substrate-binding protein DctP [Rhodospirillales bacterium]MDP6843483.1 TRAP transporter substrate-binding protein DctP [Rhodospirillales bacterium]